MVKISAQNLHLWFASHEVVKGLSLDVFENEILSIIGPANSGKTSFLRALNRLNDEEPHFKKDGRLLLDSTEVSAIDKEVLRRKVGMVFALPLPLPLSISDNVAYGPRMQGITKKAKLAEIVESALTKASLWDEVKDRLGSSAFKLSGGQQQRLCIARTLAVGPEVILFDEPCSGLDPISTAKVEETMLELKKSYTIVLVTNNVKQAARVADRTAFFLSGALIEVDVTDKIFTKPSNQLTEDYIEGRFG